MEITSNMIIKADGTTKQNINKGTGIKTPHIQDGAVTTAKIGNEAVTEIKIANGAVTESKLGDNSVTSSKIKDGSVGNLEIANGAVTESKLGDKSVTSAKIKDGSVGTDEIANGAVTSAKLANDSVTYEKLDSNTRGKLVTKGDSHTHSASDVGALPITGGTVNGIFSVNGKVGIGTQNPSFGDSRVLEINGVPRPVIRLVRPGGSEYIIGTEDVDDKLRIVNSAGVTHPRDSNKGITIDTQGKVGIGTSSPGAKLEIVADSQTWNGWYEAIRLGQSAHSAITHPGGGLLFGLHRNRVFYFADTINGNYLVTIEAAEGGILWAKRHTGGGHDYAEYFESKDDKKIDAGISVALDNGKIRPAKKDEIPIGIISASPGIVGGVHIEWPKKHLRDEFGRVITEEYKEEIMKPKKEKIKKERQKMKKKTVEEKVTKTEIAFEDGKYFQKEIIETVTREVEEPLFKEVDLYDAEKKNIMGKHRIPIMETYEEEIDVIDEKGQPVMVGTSKFETKTRPKINPEYDETKEYIPREKRPEWNCVGLLGQLPLRKGQPVAPTWIKIKDISEDVELWLVK